MGFCRILNADLNVFNVIFTSVILWYRNDRGRSPDKGSSWSDRFKSVNRDRSRSPDRAALPQHSQGGSFHKAMMERGGGGGDRNKSFNRDRSRSPSPHRQEKEMVSQPLPHKESQRYVYFLKHA